MAVRYAMAPEDTDEVGLAVGDHDPGRRLVIDPVLVHGTYLGGADRDFGWDMVVDAGGNVYLTGSTRSSDFPTVNPLQVSLAGGTDVFVSKLEVVFLRSARTV